MFCSSPNTTRRGNCGGWRFWIFMSLVVCFLAETTSPAHAQEVRVWQGGWNNRKFGTSGPLKCTAMPKSATTWEAQFEGKGLGRDFRYPATFAARQQGNGIVLQGTATIDGDVYRWFGNIAGKVLYGRYRSAKGNNGEFRLQEVSSN